MYSPSCLSNEGVSLNARASEPWSQGSQLRLDEDDDDDLNIDTSHMTPEEKAQLKVQRKLKKMSREKLKRSKVNDQFDHLCKVINAGKSTRVEKLTILNETLRTLYQLRAENKVLKEHTRQLKELRVRLQSGEPITTAFNPTTQDAKMVPSPRSGTKDGHAMLDLSMALEPLAEMQIKDEPSGKYIFDKTRVGLSSDEEGLGGWFDQPHDLDFAFGMFTQQGVFPESECELGGLVIPTEHDNVDMFLSTSDECDLLC